MAKKGKKGKDNNATDKPKRGFLVDFSNYKDEHWPIEAAYTDKVLIDKIGDFMKALLWSENPSRCGLGFSVEQLNPREDGKIISKCNFDKSAIFYASFSGQARGFIFGIDKTIQRVYILGASPKHVFRKWHNKYG